MGGEPEVTIPLNKQNARTTTNRQGNKNSRNKGKPVVENLQPAPKRRRQDEYDDIP